jgi:S-formylglutathione hydrolase FrmB
VGGPWREFQDHSAQRALSRLSAGRFQAASAANRRLSVATQTHRLSGGGRLVNGLPGGSYLDSPDGKAPIESVIIKDLIPSIDASYRTIPRREARALEGLSMGGFAVFHFGFKYPEMFSILSGMCSGVSDPHAAPRANAPNRVQTPYMLANNPFVLAETNLGAINGKLKIRSVVGTDDMTLAANKAFDARLTQLGIAHDFTIVPHVSHGYKEYYQILDFSFFKTIATTM